MNNPMQSTAVNFESGLVHPQNQFMNTPTFHASSWLVPEEMIDPGMIPPPPPTTRKENADGFFITRKPEKVVLPEIPPNSDGVTLFFYNIGKDTDEVQTD